MRTFATVVFVVAGVGGMIMAQRAQTARQNSEPARSAVQTADDAEDQDEAWVEADERQAERDEKIAERDEAVAERDQEIAEKDQEMAEVDQGAAERDQEIAEREQEAAEQVADRDQEMAERDQEAATRDQELAEHEQELVAPVPSAPPSPAQATPRTGEIVMHTVFRIGLRVSIALAASWLALGQDQVPPPRPHRARQNCGDPAARDCRGASGLSAIAAGHSIGCSRGAGRVHGVARHRTTIATASVG